MKAVYLACAAVASVAAFASPALAQNYDANPTVGFTYGTGNNYTPANAVVLTTTSPVAGVPLAELALRAHVPTQLANSTGGTGIYVFSLGSLVSFDFSAFGTALPGAQITVTNVGTGADATFAAALLGTVQANGALQGSQQLGFGFLNGFPIPSEDIDFNNQVDSTYRIDLSGGGQTVTAFAQIGAGALAPVPEPATWALMILGFGAVGYTMRRRRTTIAFAA